MPRTLTAENGAKAALVGDFFETVEVPCPECRDRREGYVCGTCRGEGHLEQRVDVSWTTIKAIYKRAVEAVGPRAEAPAEKPDRNMFAEEHILPR